MFDHFVFEHDIFLLHNLQWPKEGYWQHGRIKLRDEITSKIVCGHICLSEVCICGEEQSVCSIVTTQSMLLGHGVSSARKYFSSTSLLTTCKLKLSYAYYPSKFEQAFTWRAESPPLTQALLLCPVPTSKAEESFSEKRVPQPRLWETFYFSISSLRSPLTGRTGRSVWKERKGGMGPIWWRHPWHFHPRPVFLLNFSKEKKSKRNISRILWWYYAVTLLVKSHF